MVVHYKHMFCFTAPRTENITVYEFYRYITFKAHLFALWFT